MWLIFLIQPRFLSLMYCAAKLLQNFFDHRSYSTKFLANVYSQKANNISQTRVQSCAYDVILNDWEVFASSTSLFLSGSTDELLLPLLNYSRKLLIVVDLVKKKTEKTTQSGFSVSRILYIKEIPLVERANLDAKIVASKVVVCLQNRAYDTLLLKSALPINFLRKKRFSQDVNQLLLNSFSREKQLTSREIDRLVSVTGLEQSQIKTWFSNRRARERLSFSVEDAKKQGSCQ